MGKQQLEHSLPALFQSMLWHFQQAWASRRPSIKQPSSTVLMAASETAATITVLPAPQESQPAPLLNYDSCSSYLLPHHRHDQSCAATASTLPYSRQLQFRQPRNEDSSGGFGWHTATIQQLIPLLHPHRFRSRQSSPRPPPPANLPTRLHFLPFHLRSCRY